MAPRLESIGLAVSSVGVKDVILPGEMKTILNQVVEAEKRAQANLIQRREETAATRSLLNTARLMEESGRKREKEKSRGPMGVRRVSGFCVPVLAV